MRAGIISGIFVALIAVLAGCQTVEPRTVIGSAPSTVVTVPVIRPCLEPGQVEPLPTAVMPPRTSDIETLAAGAEADARTFRELAKRQHELLRACAGATVPAVPAH